MRVWQSASPLLRALAILIAVAAAIDPAVASRHAAKPEIAVLASQPRSDSALADRVARDLDKKFSIVRTPFATDATVLVGDGPPAGFTELSSPVFAVTPDRSGPTVTLDAVRAPAAAPFDARVPIVAVVHVTGARGRTVDVSLRSDSVVVDRATRTAASDDEHLSIPLGFLPTAPGAAALRVAAAIANARPVAAADLAIDVRDTRWSVLFYDPRPSWMSTFVRRAVERDRRFVVTSRVVTSRNVSTDAGQPPPSIDDLSSLAHFDAVVLGAPEALSDADVMGLDTYLRRRGGSVVLLLDQHTPGPYERLLNTGAWSTKSVGQGIPIAAVSEPTTDSAALRAADIAWPTSLPPGAEVVARALPTPGDTTRNRPVIWRSPVGAGRVVVSGALDAWRFRDRELSGGDFDRFWQTTVADAASASPPPLVIALSRTTLTPGEEADVTVTVRAAALAALPTGGATARPVVASASAAIISPVSAGEHRESLRLWPAGAIGEFRASFRAPAVGGVYRIVASADGATADVPIVVASAAVHAAPEAPELLAAWVGARGGRVVSASQPQVLTAALLGALHPSARVELWHPMRSALWIVPFALALCAEWWLRRRRGFA